MKGIMKIKLPMIPITFIALFLLFVLLADFAFIYFSGDYYNGLVTDNAYQKGLDYNTVLAKSANQAASGWHDTLQYDPKSGMLEFCLYDRQHAIVRPERVQIQLRHPITNRYDQNIETTINSHGCYAAVEKLPPGRWEVLLHAYVGQGKGAQVQDYYKHDFIMVE